MRNYTTQMDAARKGILTKEMEIAAGKEQMEPGELMELMAQGKLDPTGLITHSYPLSRIEEAYELFEQRRDGVVKVAVTEG